MQTDDSSTTEESKKKKWSELPADLHEHEIGYGLGRDTFSSTSPNKQAHSKIFNSTENT